MNGYSQLIAHVCGDYLFQSSWMATNKYRSWIAAIAHAVAYTSCFFFLNATRNPISLAIICITHVFVDHYRLAAFWARLVNNEWCKPQPVIPSWVIIAIDQSLHITINYLAIANWG